MTTLHHRAGPNGVTVAESALTAGDSLLTAPTTNTATVWVDSGPVTGPQGVELTPGSSQPWPAGKPLHAWASSTADLFVTDGLDAGTNPGAIASAILAQGLAAQIASQIALSGAPPIDVNTVILNYTGTSVAGTDVLLDPLDVSRYQSLSVRVSEVDTATGAPVARQVEMDWLDTSGTYQRDTDGFAVTGTNNSPFADLGIYATYQTPVRGPDLQIRLRGNSKAGTTLHVQVMGSFKSLSSPRYVLRSGYWNSAGGDTFTGKGFDNYAGFWLANTPGNTTRNFWPPVKSGQAEFTWDAQGPGGAGVQVAVQDLDSGIVLYNSGQQVASGAAGSTGAVVPQTVSLVIPNRPIQFWVQTSASSTAWQFVRGSLSFLDHS